MYEGQNAESHLEVYWIQFYTLEGAGKSLPDALREKTIYFLQRNTLIHTHKQWMDTKNCSSLLFLGE